MGKKIRRKKIESVEKSTCHICGGDVYPFRIETLRLIREGEICIKCGRWWYEVYLKDGGKNEQDTRNNKTRGLSYRRDKENARGVKGVKEPDRALL
ncbi:MAG: hypothetical protein H0Z28_11100 [Archaeoglobus sp.]|nr:hypothetical protein [Archaeoglobus sp.]